MTVGSDSDPPGEIDDPRTSPAADVYRRRRALQASRANERLDDLTNPYKIEDLLATVYRQALAFHGLCRPAGNYATEVTWAISVRQAQNDAVEPRSAPESAAICFPHHLARTIETDSEQL